MPNGEISNIHNIDINRLATTKIDDIKQEQLQKISYTGSVLLTYLAVALSTCLKNNKDLRIDNINDIPFIKKTDLPNDFAKASVGDINAAVIKIKNLDNILQQDTDNNTVGSNLKKVVEKLIQDYEAIRIVKSKNIHNNNNTLYYTTLATMFGKLIGNNNTAVIGGISGAIASVSDKVSKNKSIGENVASVFEQ